MEIAKVTSKGQITIPIEIRRILNLEEGSKVIFIKKKDSIEIKNASMLAFDEARKAFEGIAEKFGLETEEDVVKLIKEFRKEKDKK